MQKSFRWFYLLFFLSGFPALIYQIVWQRTLFAIYGVNIESVTIVVSAFMLGLGLGSLAGGRISKSPAAPLLLLFGAVELGIAAYGMASLPLFHAVARFSAGAPPLETGLLSFALVLVPTVLMGATLPLLVAQLVRLSGNVGRSVGILYFVNTLGSAVACFVTAWFTMPYLGMSRSVAVAAALNVAGRDRRCWRCTSAARGAPIVAPSTRAGRSRRSSRRCCRFPWRWPLAAARGLHFAVLRDRLVPRSIPSPAADPRSASPTCWARFWRASPLGSLLSRRLCGQSSDVATSLADPSRCWCCSANLLGFAIVPLVALAVQHISYLWTLPLVAITAGLLGATFPLMCHISVRPDSRAGAGPQLPLPEQHHRLGRGSWLVGFILMDFWSLRWISVFLALSGVGWRARAGGRAARRPCEHGRRHRRGRGRRRGALFRSACSPPSTDRCSRRRNGDSRARS